MIRRALALGLLLLAPVCAMGQGAIDDPADAGFTDPIDPHAALFSTTVSSDGAWKLLVYSGHAGFPEDASQDLTIYVAPAAGAGKQTLIARLRSVSNTKIDWDGPRKVLIATDNLTYVENYLPAADGIAVSLTFKPAEDPALRACARLNFLHKGDRDGAQCFVDLMTARVAAAKAGR